VKPHSSIVLIGNNLGSRMLNFVYLKLVTSISYRFIGNLKQRWWRYAVLNCSGRVFMEKLSGAEISNRVSIEFWK
jgi:hypothetical protein